MTTTQPAPDLCGRCGHKEYEHVAIWPELGMGPIARICPTATWKPAEKRGEEKQQGERCPTCAGELAVLATSSEREGIRKDRECLHCGRVFKSTPHGFVLITDNASAAQQAKAARELYEAVSAWKATVDPLAVIVSRGNRGVDETGRDRVNAALAAMRKAWGFDQEGTNG